MKKHHFTLIACLLMLTLSDMALANIDPATKAASGMRDILFGSFGLSLSAIFVGVTFLLAKTGKITWDRFVGLGICVAGFLGAPGIVTLLKSWVSN